ncbi:adenylate kinase family protein [Candidatus Woesearchaeota archaeon]|nr:adenylate kinase family protein [Candidatus Woesearchaeota archaeon]
MKNKKSNKHKIKVILVTGSVGAGKTTIARALSKKTGFMNLILNSLIRKNKLYDSYDRKDKCLIVDTKKLNAFLIKKIRDYKKRSKEDNRIKGLIIDSHLSHYLPSRYADLCIVAKCSLKILEKRLKKRGYSKNKIKDNIECEIFDVCLNEAKEARHKVAVIDSTKGINISRIIQKIKI